MLKSEQRTRLAKFSPIEDLASELHGQVGCLHAVYDFSVLGGAVGTIALLDRFGEKAKLPAGAIIKSVLINVETAATSGGLATLAFSSEGAADLKAATAVASFSGDALLDGVPDNTAANAILLTAERNISLVVAVAALIAGKVHVFCDYVLRS